MSTVPGVNVTINKTTDGVAESLRFKAEVFLAVTDRLRGLTFEAAASKLRTSSNNINTLVAGELTRLRLEDLIKWAYILDPDLTLTFEARV